MYDGDESVVDVRCIIASVLKRYNQYTVAHTYFPYSTYRVIKPASAQGSERHGIEALCQDRRECPPHHHTHRTGLCFFT